MKKFYNENKTLTLYTALLVFFTYGIKLFNNNYAIDTMNLMGNYDGYLLHWISIGRPGLVLLKLLTYDYVNVYFMNVLTIVCFALASILICYFIDLSLKHEYNKKWLFIIPSIFTTHQIFSEQFYFVLQSFEFALGICLVVLALIGIYHNKNILVKVLSVLLLSFTFTIYQSFFVFSCTLILFKILMDINNKQYANSKLTVEKFLIKIINFFSISLISLAISQLIVFCVKKFFNVQSSYLNGMFKWGTQPFSENIKEIKNYIHEVFLPPIGHDFFTPLLFVCLVLLIIVLISMAISKKKNIFSSIVILAGIFTTPFMFAILQGGRPILRSEVPNFPLVLSLLLFFVSLYLKNNTSTKFILISIVTLFSFIQVRETINIQYSDQARAFEDIRTTEMITNKIYSMNLDKPSSYKLIIYGGRESRNISKKIGETTGISLYNFAPNTLNESHLILMYMGTLGISFDYPTQEEFDKYRYLQSEMDIWPNGNSIKVIDHCIILNLAK